MKHLICRTVLAVAAVTAGIFLSACGLFHDPADDVFDDAEDAIATDLAADDVKTAQFEYVYGDGNTATIRFQAPENVRIDLMDDNNSMIFCLNGDTGWMYMGGEILDMTEEDILEMHAALLQTIPFKVDFQELFTDAKLQDELEDVCGEECKVIEAAVRVEPSIKVKFWIGEYTDLVRQFEIAREDGVYTMQYFDYATFENDITLPSEMFRFTPDGNAKLSLVSFETNVEIPDYVFRKPEMVNITEGDK